MVPVNVSAPPSQPLPPPLIPSPSQTGSRSILETLAASLPPVLAPPPASSPFHFILHEELLENHREPPRHGRRCATVVVHPPPSRRIQELRNVVYIVCVQGIEPKPTTATGVSSSSSPVSGEIRPLRSSSVFPKHASIDQVSPCSFSPLKPLPDHYLSLSLGRLAAIDPCFSSAGARGQSALVLRWSPRRLRSVRSVKLHLPRLLLHALALSPPSSLAPALFASAVSHNTVCLQFRQVNTHFAML
jgi:hypothetical protein